MPTMGLLVKHRAWVDLTASRRVWEQLVRLKMPLAELPATRKVVVEQKNRCQKAPLGS